MKVCDCGGALWRHGTTRGKTGNSYRYLCSACRKAMTAPIVEDAITGKVLTSCTGRPMLKDWRHAACLAMTD